MPTPPDATPDTALTPFRPPERIPAEVPIHEPCREALRSVEGALGEVRAQIASFEQAVYVNDQRLRKLEGRAPAVPLTQYKTVRVLEDFSYRSHPLIIATPTRGMVPAKFVAAREQVMRPPNMMCGSMYIEGGEIGVVCNRIVELFLSQKSLQWVLFHEDDILPPRDGLLRLLRWVDHGYKIIAGLYYIKQPEGPVPLAYRAHPNPERVEEDALHSHSWIPMMPGRDWNPGEAIEVDATGLGWTLMHRSIFEKIEPPWFKTLAEVTPTGGKVATQDIFWAGRILDYKKKTGEDIRWLLDTSVRCGHLSVGENRVY